MKACILTGPRQFKIIERPKPSVGPNDVLIKVLACGVCASELHSWRSGEGGSNSVLGHEPVGIVEERGGNVEGFELGDRVTGLMYGALAEYITADYRNLVRVPAGLTDVEALGEPLSCLFSAIEKTPFKLGDRVAVIGLGFMGLGMLQLARLKGAGEIIAIDLRPESFDTAKRFGANVTLTPEQVSDDFKIVKWEHMSTRTGIPLVIEVTGSQKGLDLAADITGVHGMLSIVGFHQGAPRSVNMEMWNWKAITAVSAHERRTPVHLECMKSALNMIERGAFNMKAMITHEFALEEAGNAYQTLEDKPQGFIKAVVRVS
jgi:threonine dehydrogenase-like Zn-dependent dehydrogenase